MGKSIITIEEETIKTEKDKILLKRKITVNSSRGEFTIYEDEITSKQLVFNNTQLNNFERWVLELYEKKLSGSTLKKQQKHLQNIHLL